jgi:hypothetical protein
MWPASLKATLGALALPALAAASAASAAGADVRPPSPEERTLAAEAFALHRAVADRIWPGWGDAPMAIVLVADDVEMGFGLGTMPEDAVPAEPLGDRDVWVRPRTVAPNLAASFPYLGVPAAILGLPQATGVSPTQWLITAQHELFHVLQMRRGSIAKVAALEIGPQDDAMWQLDFPFPYDDDAVMAGMHTLGYCLYQAMTAEENGDARYAAGTAADALAALESLLREKTGDEKAFLYVRFQMHKEGVALWTEREVTKAATEPGVYTPSAEFLALPEAVLMAELWENRYATTPFLVKHAGRAARSRTMFYHLGFGVASALQRVRPDWRGGAFAPDVWVDALLAADAPACPPE